MPRDLPSGYSRGLGVPDLAIVVQWALMPRDYAVCNERVTVKKVTPYTLRHGAAMAMLRRGVDLSVIALWLGHESTETTQIYVHAWPPGARKRKEGPFPPQEAAFRAEACRNI